MHLWIFYHITASNLCVTFYSYIMPNLPQFLNKLFALVNDPSWCDLIRWENDGENFVITDPTEFSRRILPAYFKHKNFSSFVRQLNHYGFSKLSADEWIFGHRNFKFGQQDQLTGIIRKKNHKINQFHSSNDNDTLFGRKLQADIEFLKKSRQSFSKNFVDLCSRQEYFLLQQQNLESNQKKLEMDLKLLEDEVCQLKSFIFGYLSKIIGKDDEIELTGFPFFSENKPLVENLDRKKKDRKYYRGKSSNEENFILVD